MKSRKIWIVLTLVVLVFSLSGCENLFNALFGPAFAGSWSVEETDSGLIYKVTYKFDRDGSFEYNAKMADAEAEPKIFVTFMAAKGNWESGEADDEILVTANEIASLQNSQLVWEDISDPQTETFTWVVDGDELTLTVDSIEFVLTKD